MIFFCTFSKTTRWFLKRLHQNEFKIVNIGSNTDISRSLRSVIKLDKVGFPGHADTLTVGFILFVVFVEIVPTH